MDYLYLLPTHLNRDEKEIKKLYKRMGVIKDDPENDPKENEFYQFCLNYGQAFALPYHGESFDFGDNDFNSVIRTYTKNAPISNEPRGNKNFIYSTRAHLGLYHMLMKMEAVVKTSHSIRIVEEILLENAT